MFLRMVVRSFRIVCAGVEIGAVMCHGLAFVTFNIIDSVGCLVPKMSASMIDGGVLHWLFTFKCCQHEALDLWNGVLRCYDFLEYTHDTLYRQASHAYINLTYVYT